MGPNEKAGNNSETPHQGFNTKRAPWDVVPIQKKGNLNLLNQIYKKTMRTGLQIKQFRLENFSIKGFSGS